MRDGQIGLQAGQNKGASQSGLGTVFFQNEIDDRIYLLFSFHLDFS